MTDPTFWLLAVPVVFIVALSKSGLLGSLGLIGVPVLSLVMSPRDAAGLMLPVLLCMDAVGLLAYRRQFDARILWNMLPGALAGIVIGWALSSFVSDAAVLLMVGIITLLFVLDEWLPLRRQLEDLPPSKPWGRFWGAVAGFTSFVSHTGGPPFQIYALPQRLDPPVYAATNVWFFAVVNAVKLIPYFFLGQISATSLTESALLAPVGIAGMMVGVWLVRRISATLFYRIAYVLVFLVSLKLIWDGVGNIFLN